MFPVQLHEYTYATMYVFNQTYSVGTYDRNVTHLLFIFFSVMHSEKGKIYFELYKWYTTNYILWQKPNNVFSIEQTVHFQMYKFVV